MHVPAKHEGAQRTKNKALQKASGPLRFKPKTENRGLETIGKNRTSVKSLAILKTSHCPKRYVNVTKHHCTQVVVLVCHTHYIALEEINLFEYMSRAWRIRREYQEGIVDWKTTVNSLLIVLHAKIVFQSKSLNWFYQSHHISNKVFFALELKLMWSRYYQWKPPRVKTHQILENISCSYQNSYESTD